MATHDLSKFTIEDLVYDAGVPFRAFTAEEAVAEITRRMTPPPGCVRIGDKDVKVLGELPMTADGCAIASMFADVWAIHERTGKPYKTSLYHRGFLSKLYSTEEAAKAAIKLCYPFAENVCNNPKCNCREEKQAAETARSSK
jgi:hypothetical protein